MGSIPDIPAIFRAENIALLCLLHSASSKKPLQVIPTAPSSQALNHFSSASEYELPFIKERSLVGTLAFLAQTEEDRNHIPAICVVQQTDRLNVLIAINRNKWSDGDSILHALKERFNIIFAILQTVLEREWLCLHYYAARPDNKLEDPSVVEEILFANIVDMCSLRILQRLGLRASRTSKKSKRPLREILQKVMKFARQVAAECASESLRATARLFRDKAREITSLIDSWQGHQTAARLGDLVRGINHLHKVNQFRDLLNEIPAPGLQDDEKKSFLNAIGKVSRYAETPRILRRTAKKFSVARNITAIPVKLPRDAFYTPMADTYAPNIESSVNRIDPQYSKPKKLSRVYHLLGYGDAESVSLFSEQVHGTLQEAKIHAEVQLIIYCELQRPRFFPRVVCSSKDACFLCSAFICLHKQMHTPRCHGRLYPGWRLPFLPEVKELGERFNERLENSIKESLSILFTRQRKTTYLAPNESTLLTIPISELTESGLTRHDSGQPSCKNSSQLHFQTADKSYKGPESGNSNHADASIPCSAACERSTTDLEFSSTADGKASVSKDNSKQVLSQGMVLHNSVDPGGSSACYIAGPIKLAIEYATGLEGIKYSVEWLTTEEVKDLQSRAHPPLTVDVESLASEMSIWNHNSVCISVKGTVLRLNWESKSA